MVTAKKEKKAKEEKAETVAKPPKFEMPSDIKVEIVEAPVLQTIKEKAALKGTKYSATAMSMAEKMLKDISAGARIDLSSPELQNSKDQIKKLLKRDLSRIAKKAGHRYEVRTADDGQALVFFFEQKPEKQKKQDKAA